LKGVTTNNLRPWPGERGFQGRLQVSKILGRGVEHGKMRKEDLPHVLKGHLSLGDIGEVGPAVVFKGDVGISDAVEESPLKEERSRDQLVPVLKNPAKVAGRWEKEAGLVHGEEGKGWGREAKAPSLDGRHERAVIHPLGNGLIGPKVADLTERELPLQLNKPVRELDGLHVNIEWRNKVAGRG